MHPKPKLRVIQKPQTGTSLELAISEYLIAAQQSGLAPTSLTQYRWHLNRLADWLARHGQTRPDQLTPALLRKWGASLWAGWGPASVKQAIGAARSWLSWCYSEHLIDEQHHTSLRVPKVKARIQRTLWPDEVRKLLAVLDPEKPKGIRDEAIIRLLLDSGLRAAELCRLRLDDVQFNVRLPKTNMALNMLKVIVKGGHEKPGYFGQTTARKLRAWLRVREAEKGIQTVFVAVGGLTPGQSLTVRGLREIVAALGRKAEVPRVSTHAFRRTFRVLLLEQGAPDELTQEWGRWEDGRMLRRYRLAYEAGKLYNLYTPTDFLDEIDGV